MNRGFSCSKGAAAFAAAAFVAVGALLWIRSVVDSRATALRGAAAARDAELSSQIAARSDCSAASLEELRRQARQYRSHLGPPQAKEGVARLFGSRWNASDEETSENGERETVARRFSMVSPTAADWPEILETVRGLEEIPGASVVELAIKADAGREHQGLEYVRLAVSVRTRRETDIPPYP